MARLITVVGQVVEDLYSGMPVVVVVAAAAALTSQY